ncbi:phosphoribosyl-AMP cyclohydrolase [Spirochaeta africana]|nr:phosphoribosyl-AMP cyclohydrolase [Spirochaeta africana]
MATSEFGNMIEEGTRLQLQFQKRGGLLPVVVQNCEDGMVLMLGYADPAALQHTLATGYATFYSTSRGKLWTKGETSGDRLQIQEVLVDCDQDSLLYRVEMLGDGACHTTRHTTGTARRSCFYRRIDGSGNELAFLPDCD